MPLTQTAFKWTISPATVNVKSLKHLLLEKPLPKPLIRFQILIVKLGYESFRTLFSYPNLTVFFPDYSWHDFSALWTKRFCSMWKWFSITYTGFFQQLFELLFADFWIFYQISNVFNEFFELLGACWHSCIYKIHNETTPKKYKEFSKILTNLNHFSL